VGITRPFIEKIGDNVIYFKVTLAQQRTVHILSFPSAQCKFIVKYGYSAFKETNAFQSQNCSAPESVRFSDVYNILLLKPSTCNDGNI
jgi:hypothetical protein